MSFFANKAIPSLPIAKICHKTFQFLFTQPPHFWIGCGSIIAILTSFSLLENFAEHLQEPHQINKKLVIIFPSFLWLIKILLFCRLAIVCHRLIILGEAIEHWLDFFYWSRRETEFAIRAALLYIALNVIATIYDVEKFYFLIIASCSYMLSIYAVCRISLILPSIATDDSLSTSWAWELSKGNGWRITLLTGIIPCFFFILEHSQFNIWGILPSVPLNIQFFIENIWILFLGLFHFVLLSISYQVLITQERSSNLQTDSFLA